MQSRLFSERPANDEFPKGTDPDPMLEKIMTHSKVQPSEGIEWSWPSWRTLVAIPILFAMIVPLAFFDLCLEFYHHTVFPILSIPLVPRSSYIRFDRHRLPYLPWILKVACSYCSYANGLVQYASRIAGDTEWYFCPSKHQNTPGFYQPRHHEHFADYGDAAGFHQRFQGTHVTRESDRK